MMASFGPFNFLPGDTQQLEVLLGVGEGGDRLSSVTVLKFSLEAQNPPPPPGCCTGLRGNVTDDPDEHIDIADLIYLVQYAFGNYPEPPCPDEADINRDLVVDISDIAWLVSYMFRDGPPPATCSWL
jgi:hypothetical protein